MKKFFGLLALFLCFNACANDSGAINREFTSVEIGNRKTDFKDSKYLDDNGNVHNTYPVGDIYVEVFRRNRGEGEWEFDDNSFLEIEKYVHKGIEPNNGLEHNQVIKIGKYTFVRAIQVTDYAPWVARLRVSLFTTTPEHKILIVLSSLYDITDIFLEEAPDYFYEAEIEDIYSGSSELQTKTIWKPSNEPKEFVKKMVAGKCESKKIQALYYKIEELIKTTKIK